MKKLLLITFLALFYQVGKAQNGGQVSGVILDDQSTPLPFVNVLVLQSSDSTLVKAASTDEAGKFLVTEVPFGSYVLRFSSVGFKDFYTPKLELTAAAKTLSLEPFKMQQNTNELAEVTVTAKKPFIEQQIDKTVLNVENSIVSSGNTALEVLEKAPGVLIDRQNDAIKLKNKSGVLVMIDGRKNYMSNESLMQYLSNMPSDQIATIEIITNPSSKYEASGNSGIINIKLKKNQSYGTNGTVSVALGDAYIPNSVDDLYRASESLSLNHRNKKWNIFAHANSGRNAFYNDNHLIRSTNYEGLRSEFDQVSKRNGHGIYYSGKIGADYFLSEKTTLGLMLDASGWEGKMKGTGLTNIREMKNDSLSISSLIPDSDRDMSNVNLTGNFNIKHNFNQKGKEMTFDVDYSYFNNDTYQYFDTQYFNSSNAEGEQAGNMLQQNWAPSKINIFATKLDFVIPTENKMKFEFGAKSSYVKTDNDFKFEYQREDGEWISDTGKTNHFIYSEFVNAAYVNFSKEWGKVGLQAGLRAEHTHSVANSVTLDNTVTRDYLNLFPTLFFNQKLGEDHALRYSYSRRVGRPNYEQLNPFLFFLDPYTYEKGNEYLTPQFTDNVELTYTLKNEISLSLGYAYTKDNIFDVIEQDDETRVTYQTSKNLHMLENYSANLSFPITVTKWWNMQNNASLYYAHFQDPNVSGEKLNVGQLAYNFYTSSTFTLKKGWSAEANMWYNSPAAYGIVKTTKPQFALNAGIQKSLWDKKANIKLNVSDIFLNSFFNGTIDYANVDLKISNRWTSRRATLSFTYNFGNQNVKGSRKRSTATDDLKNRVGGNN